MSTQMSNLSPHRQHGESAGTPVVILVTPSFVTIITFITVLVMMMVMTTTTSDMNIDDIRTKMCLASKPQVCAMHVNDQHV